MTTVETPREVEPAPATEPSGAATQPPFWRRHWRLLTIVGILVLWRIGLAIFRGEDTLAVGGAELNDLQRSLNDLKDTIDGQRETNWFFNDVIGGISDAINWIVDNAQQLLSQPVFPRPVPEIGWLGVVAIALWIAFALAGDRKSVV